MVLCVSLYPVDMMLIALLAAMLMLMMGVRGSDDAVCGEQFTATVLTSDVLGAQFMRFECV